MGHDGVLGIEFPVENAYFVAVIAGHTVMFDQLLEWQAGWGRCCRTMSEDFE